MPLKMLSESKKTEGLSSIKNIIGIAAGKGGVGKSTVTVNLARALKKLGYSIGILDTDVYGPSIRKMLPEDRLPGRKGNLLTPALSEGIKLLSLAHFRKENEAAAIRAPIANSIINQFLNGVLWGELDFLLIDFPPGTGDIQLTLSQQANLSGAIMVTTPQEISILDVKKAMSLFDQVKIPIIGVIENMSYYWNASAGEKTYLFGKGGGGRLATESGVPFLGQIPIEALLCESADQGISLFDGAEIPNSAVYSFMQIAKNITEYLKDLNAQDPEILQKFELIWRELPHAAGNSTH